MYPKRFITASITVNKIWKQSKCPSTDEWLRKMESLYVYICIHTHRDTQTHTHTHTHTHNGILFRHKKRKNAICSDMVEPRDYHTK